MTRENSFAWLTLTLVPVRSESANFGVAGTVEDVTETRTASMALAEYARQLERAQMTLAAQAEELQALGGERDREALVFWPSSLPVPPLR